MLIDVLPQLYTAMISLLNGSYMNSGTTEAVVGRLIYLYLSSYIQVYARFSNYTAANGAQPIEGNLQQSS